MSVLTKPALVFFQYRYDDHLPPFVLIHKEEHVKCLSEFFHVTVINHDCDYQQICDQHAPDLVLFESGLPYLSSRRPEIRNCRANHKIPKIGLLHSDSFSEHRAGFLSDMDKWDINTFFAIATTAAEYTPSIADQLFIWPNCVDADIYHDYGQDKNIPVLLTGSQSALYPWRQAVYKTISPYYPTLQCPHGGYEPHSTIAQLMVGESYARLLNASWCVPTCGTAAKELVRKHFEIPACKSCLITEHSPALEIAGFVDMYNCVMASEHDVLDKLEHLFEHRDKLQAISEAGHELVRTRHTSKHRDQILQWFKLYKNLQPHQQIIQHSPFESLCVVNKAAQAASSHIICHGPISTLLREGDRKLWDHRVDEAELLYLRCLGYYQWMPEPHLKLGLCCLYKGDAKRALEWIRKPIGFTLTEYRAADADPVEWAYFLIALLCVGKLDEAVTQSREFGWMRHPELDRARWAVGVCSGKKPMTLPGRDEGGTHRASVHHMVSRSVDLWIQELCVMLAACGQSHQAEIFRKHKDGMASDLPTKTIAHPGAGSSGDRDWIASKAPTRRERDARGPGHREFIRKRAYSRIRLSVRRTVRKLLHSIEVKHGYFLPYHLSAAKDDELCNVIRELGRQDCIKTAMIVGSTPSGRNTQALLSAAVENKSNPDVFCIGGFKGRRGNYSEALASYPFVKLYEVTPAAVLEDVRRALKSVIEKTKLDNRKRWFDFVLIDGCELGGQCGVVGEAMRELNGARCVVVNGVNMKYIRDDYGTLLMDSSYVLVRHNLTLRGCYAIFEKRSSAADSSVEWRSPTITIS